MLTHACSSSLLSTRNTHCSARCTHAHTNLTRNGRSIHKHHSHCLPAVVSYPYPRDNKLFNLTVMKTSGQKCAKNDLKIILYILNIFKSPRETCYPESNFSYILRMCLFNIGSSLSSSTGIVVPLTFLSH